MAFDAGLEVNTPENPHFIKGVTAGDFDNDGWQDIFISTVNADSRSFLFKNTGNISENGAPVFLDITEKAGLGEPFSSFPTWFWDYNNDGFLDIFAAGYKKTDYFSSITNDIASEYLGIPHQAETVRLFKNNGNGTFSDVSEEANLNRILYGMGANYGDLDNDGFLDMYISTGEVNITSIIPNRMFRNNGGENFQDVTSAGGFGNIQKGHAVSFADLDNDGDQDVHTVMGGAYEGDIYFNSLYENPYDNENNWLKIKLEGSKSNRAGIGSKIKLILEENGVERTIYREVNSGGSFGCNPLRIEIGLGKANIIKELQIIWAGSGTIQNFNDIDPNNFYIINEGKPLLEEVKLNWFEFVSKSNHSHSVPFP